MHSYGNQIVEGPNARKVKDLTHSITPGQEFWGHCSNLQAWVENGYDTRILHRNIAFPLLKKLTIVGDKQAKKVFKDEIVKRYLSGYPPVQRYLSETGYFKYFNKEELELLIENLNENSKEINLLKLWI